MLLLLVWWWAAAASVATGSPLDLDRLADRLAFLKDYFKVHLYVNPHPACALYAEPCSLDGNCCGGLECLMTAESGGIGSVCRPKVTDAAGGGDVVGWDEEANPDTVEVGWNLDGGEGSTAEEVQRERAKAKARAEADTTAELIQELRRPLSLEEMTSLRRMQEADELRRDEELRQLTRWKEDKDEEEREKEREKERIETLARERVERVLKEEDKQKMEMLQRMRSAITTGGNDKQ